jgi:hypothetical protein
MPTNYWKIGSNQTKKVIEIGKKLGISENQLEKWYEVTQKEVIENGGSTLLKINGFSLPKLLKVAFPEFNWNDGNFSKKPQGYWKTAVNERNLLQDVARKLGIKEGDLEGWYKFTGSHVADNGGKPLMKIHNDSLLKVLKSGYPDHKWDPRRLSMKPRYFWTDMSNQKDAMITIGHKLGIKDNDFDGWYKVNNAMVLKNGGNVLLHKHQNSLNVLLREVFPEHPWDNSKFSTKPQNFWKSKETQRLFLEELSLKLGIQVGNYAAWYKITNNDVSDKGGAVLLEYHKGSVSQMVATLYPEHHWELSKFSRRPKKFWHSLENQKAYVIELGKKFNITPDNLQGWYRLSNKDIISNGGGSILEFHSFSKYKLLRTVFPDHDWDLNMFSSKPANFWKSSETQKAFIEEFAKKKDFHDLDSWYEVSAREIKAQGGSSLLTYHNGSLNSILKSVYPDHVWDISRFRVKGRSGTEITVDSPDFKTFKWE